jgi:hypothetical protein
VTLAVAASLGLWFAYSPEHLLWHVNFATVSVDDHPVPASVYIGHPTENEADAIALVHVPAVGDYFLDFDGETYREASDQEFVRFKLGAWTCKSMHDGNFDAPLPFRHLNEFRFVSSNGHVVTVQF